MTDEEKGFIEQKIIEVVANNKGISTEAIIEYLDYTNKVLYDKSEILLIIQHLIDSKRVINNKDLYFFLKKS